MTVLKLTLEAFAGSDIKQVCEEMSNLAEKIDCIVEVDFNGVKLWAKSGGSAERLMVEYRTCLKGDSYIDNHSIAKSWV